MKSRVLKTLVTAVVSGLTLGSVCVAYAACVSQSEPEPNYDGANAGWTYDTSGCESCVTGTCFGVYGGVNEVYVCVSGGTGGCESHKVPGTVYPGECSPPGVGTQSQCGCANCSQQGQNGWVNSAEACQPNG